MITLLEKGAPQREISRKTGIDRKKIRKISHDLAQVEAMFQEERPALQPLPLERFHYFEEGTRTDPATRLDPWSLRVPCVLRPWRPTSIHNRRLACRRYRISII